MSSSPCAAVPRGSPIDIGQRIQLLRAAAGIDQHVDQQEGECLAGRRAADAELGHQRPHVERARRRVDRVHRRVIDFHGRGVEEHGIVDLHRIAVQGRAGDEIEAAARGVDLVLQPHQHAAVAGVDVLQGHNVEPREDSHQAVANLGVGQAVVVQAVEIERRQADRRARGGRRRLVGRAFAGRAARGRARHDPHVLKLAVRAAMDFQRIVCRGIPAANAQRGDRRHQDNTPHDCLQVLHRTDRLMRTDRTDRTDPTDRSDESAVQPIKYPGSGPNAMAIWGALPPLADCTANSPIPSNAG